MKCSRPGCGEAARFSPIIMVWPEGAERWSEPAMILLKIAICGKDRLDWLDFPPDRLVLGFWDLADKKTAAIGSKKADRTRWKVEFAPAGEVQAIFNPEGN